jgi:hypothetical protein
LDQNIINSPGSQSLRFQDPRRSPSAASYLTAAEHFPATSKPTSRVRSGSSSNSSAYRLGGDDDTVTISSPLNASFDLGRTPREKHSSQHSWTSGSLSPIGPHYSSNRSSFASRPTSPSRSPSPAHHADVPKGVDSDTDAETSDTAHVLAPAPPPKDEKHSKALHAYTPSEMSPDMTTGDLSEYAVDESPVEQTSHSTFIAPALPPIRFSMNNADFSELLDSVNGLPALKPDNQAKRGKESQGSVPSTTPPTAMSISIPKPPSGERLSAMSTGNEEQVNPTMTLTPVQDDATDSTVVIDQSPEVNKVQTAKQLELDNILRRLRGSINSAKDRGARQVQVDINFADTVIELLESRDTAFCRLKTKLDGMNVRPLLCLTYVLEACSLYYDSAKVNVTLPV